MAVTPYNHFLRLLLLLLLLLLHLTPKAEHGQMSFHFLSSTWSSENGMHFIMEVGSLLFHIQVVQLSRDFDFFSKTMLMHAHHSASQAWSTLGPVVTRVVCCCNFELVRYRQESGWFGPHFATTGGEKAVCKAVVLQNRKRYKGCLYI